MIGASHDLSPDRGSQAARRAILIACERRLAGRKEGRKEGTRGKLTATNDPNHNGEVASDEAAPAPALCAGTTACKRELGPLG